MIKFFQVTSSNSTSLYLAGYSLNAVRQWAYYAGSTTFKEINQSDLPANKSWICTDLTFEDARSLNA